VGREKGRRTPSGAFEVSWCTHSDSNACQVTSSDTRRKRLSHAANHKFAGRSGIGKAKVKGEEAEVVADGTGTSEGVVADGAGASEEEVVADGAGASEEVIADGAGASQEVVAGTSEAT
jgi:hypothetical protein